MNNKLTEIAIKAQVEHCVSHVRLQEFADFIIDECAKAVEQWKSEPFPLDPQFAAKLIREHFNDE